MYSRSLAARLDHLEEMLLPKPGAEILDPDAYSTPEAFTLALHAAEARGSAIIIDDIPRATLWA